MTMTAIPRPRTLADMKTVTEQAAARREAAYARADASGTLWTAIGAMWPDRVEFIVYQGRLTAQQADSLIDSTFDGFHAAITLHPIKGTAEDCIADTRAKIKTGKMNEVFTIMPKRARP